MVSSPSIIEHRSRLQGDAGTFHVFSFKRASVASFRPLLVLPNGYGTLTYARTLCRHLAARGHPTYTVDVCGQGESAGSYSIPGAMHDIARTIEYLTAEEPSKIDMIVHCSSMLPLIDLGRNHPAWDAVQSVLLYCYLAHPADHFPRFKRKCVRHHVRLDEQVGDLDRYGPEAYCEIPVRLSVVHPRTAVNLRRATLAELDILSSRRPLDAVRTPLRGYNISSRAQQRAVKQTADHEFLSILTPSRKFGRDS